MKPKTIRGTVGRGYVGAWNDGRLGWFLPDHLEPSTSHLSADKAASHPDWSNIGVPSYLCKITIEPITTKAGRLIVRRVK
jgi:hypothetical protein